MFGIYWIWTWTATNMERFNRIRTFFVTFSNLNFNFRNFMSELTEDLQKSINHLKNPRKLKILKKNNKRTNIFSFDY